MSQVIMSFDWPDVLVVDTTQLEGTVEPVEAEGHVTEPADGYVDSPSATGHVVDGHAGGWVPAQPQGEVDVREVP